MREIKFRAWDKEKKKWLSFDEGDPIQHDYTGFSTLGYWVEVFDFDEDRVVLMQYTGLKDKNGVDIYEGDVLKMAVSKFVPDEDGFDWEEIIVEVYFDSGGFWYKGAGRMDHNWHFHNQNEREVIGNKYENPELLDQNS